MTRFNITVLCVALLGLAGCSSYYPAPVAEISDTPLFLDSGRVHRVNSGETLYAIAWMYDLDFTALARANSLREPYVITPGQILTVDLRGEPQSTTTTATTTALASAAPVGPATVNPVAVTTPVARSPLPANPITRQPLPTSPALEPTGGATTQLPTTTEPGGARVADNKGSEQGSAVAIGEPPVPDSATVDQAVPTGPAADKEAQTVATLPEPGVPRETKTPSAPVMPPEPEPEPVPTSQPATATAAIQWGWPTGGNLVGRFNADSNAENKGVDFAGERGDPVLAAADGEVVYAGSGLLRYGDLVILKHDDHFLSAYAHNSRILVSEGQRIARGEKIAEIGSSGIDRNMLHFEIRLDGKPVDPLEYLPSR